MSPPRALSLVNLQSEVSAPILASVAEQLTQTLGFPVRFIDDGNWMERRDAFLRAEVDLAFLCGLPYAIEADRPEPRVSLVAAPVMAAPRYADAPVYFSDVVVKRNGPRQCFVDLEGATWAYNEPASHSGYWLPRYELARRQAPPGFFGQVIEAGSHMAALALVRSGVADAAPIDSTVLELAALSDPGMLEDLRVIETWGPSAMPPLLASARVPAATRQAVTKALLAMAGSTQGRAALATGLVSRFAAVTDSDFDPIRRMAAIGAGYPLRPCPSGLASWVT
jgi:phosphonate transport system substrate-binding protein